MSQKSPREILQDSFSSVDRANLSYSERYNFMNILTECANGLDREYVFLTF